MPFALAHNRAASLAEHTLTRLEQRLMPHHRQAAHVFAVALRVGHDPVSCHQLRRDVARIGDTARIDDSARRPYCPGIGDNTCGFIDDIGREARAVTRTRLSSEPTALL